MPSIATYLRIRPQKQASDSFEVTPDEPNMLKVLTPAASAPSGTDTSMMQYKFKFGKIFGPETEQEEIFDVVAKRICDGFLEGFNGTIFAYGQTGSGKTHTIEGSYREYKNRGMLPRAIAYVYERLSEKMSENAEVQMKITYLEIYNDTAYDLLNAASGANARLPKVSVVERGGSAVVHNLSMHGAPTQELAQNLLFVGKTNRTVAKTSMNLASSRSHSIFTLTLSMRQGDKITTSKLNLVDLAGSERVHKSGAAGQQLTEAKHINLSLHYLESVIVSLQVSNRKRHVPYRNSLLTKLLKDSLGGNCLTAMIATISTKDSNKYESISTCRFAQRVACVDNHAQRNEVLDDKSLIRQLRERIASLQAELALAKQLGGSPTRSNTSSSQIVVDDTNEAEADRSTCQSIVRRYLKGRVGDPIEAAGSAANIRVVMEMMKSLILDEREQAKTLSDAVEKGEHNAAQLRDLQKKFGVAQAKLRNKEVVDIKPSGYGAAKSSRTGVRSESPKSPPPQGYRGRSSDGRRTGSLGGRSSPTEGHNGFSEQKRKQSIGGPASDAIREARERSQGKLVQLIMAEDDTVLMVQEVTERLIRQKASLRKCDSRDTDRMLIEKNMLEQLKNEQALLSDQLKQLKRVRGDLEAKLKDLDTMEAQVIKKQGIGSRRSSQSTSSPAPSTQKSKSMVNVHAENNPQKPSKRRVSEAQMELHKRELETRSRLESLKRQIRAESNSETTSGGSYASNSSPARGIHPSGSRFASGALPVTFERLAEDDPRDSRSAWNHSRLSTDSNSPRRGGSWTHSGANAVKTFNQLRKDERGWSSGNAPPPLESAPPPLEEAPSFNVARQSSSRQSAGVTSSKRRNSEQKFMSAFEKQRSRVNKIRQTIQAAKVIQQAWRAYKARKR